MPPSVNGSRDALQPLSPLTPSEDRRRTGRYLAVGAVLVVTLLTLHHVLLRDASTIAGVCIPTTIMGCYVLWILYSVRRDKKKARLLASAMQLTEVIGSGMNDASDERTKARTIGQTLSNGMMGMITTSGKSVMTQSPRMCETSEIAVDNDKNLCNIIA